MKIRITLSALFIFFTLFSVGVNAQSFVSLSTGVSADINKPNKSFYHIPVSLQWKPFKFNRSPLFFEFDYDIPLSCKSTGNAYTLNPSLPAEVTLGENIHPYLFTISMGFRIHLYTDKRNNSFYLSPLIGLCSQKFIVDYKNYDKANYEILNPDVDLNKGGFVVAIEAAYNFHNRRQDMFLMIKIQAPPLQTTGDYPLSFKYIAPLQLTYGYKLFYNKKKVK